ncbi:putative cholesterol oxidase [Parvularcula bermudensis HTCC2503]|uniref:Cholesterol oxidase n=1 Tax=Parvularcula bermudensis (strain ATCC BAA-594 / HTCC2503 / KCTC 12087) TaxID=314260 RepID=E0TBM8_PARBH|nr:putative cholesterol oxidase [Parvularcula bermudensis HTCC2503]
MGQNYSNNKQNIQKAAKQTKSGVSTGRRDLLKVGLASALSTSVLSAPAIARPFRQRERHRAVIIGTGFGGAVTALRLAQAGIDVTLLERGIRWPSGPNGDTFPDFEGASKDPRTTWLSNAPAFQPIGQGGVLPDKVLEKLFFKPFTGLQERVVGNGLDIICGAGVGGGSLTYQGVTMQPSEAQFVADLPGLDYGKFDRDYYRRVEAMLRLAPIPDDLLYHPTYKAALQWHDRIAAAGETPYRTRMPIDWSFAQAELRGEMKPVYTTGDLVFGVNNGGKFSLDKTYIAAAEATGRVSLKVLHNVTDIHRDRWGRWLVDVDIIDTGGEVMQRKRLVTDALFLGAGSAGTTRLLMKAKAKDQIADLPDDVGGQWGNNGDRIFVWRPSDVSPGPQQGGPTAIALQDWDNPGGPLTLMQGPVPAKVDVGVSTLVGFGPVSPGGYFTYDERKDDAVLNWDQAVDRELTQRITAKMQEVVGPDDLLFDTTTAETTTWHPLGGAIMGKVCDLAGRVMGQTGLYVVDGALIAGSTGACNPSMTIAALAEHCIETVLKEDLGRVF